MCIRDSFKTDGIAVILLSEKGYLLVMQVDGAGSYPARTLFEQYTFSFDSSYAHQIKLASKSGLSETATFDQALEAHSFLGLVPLGSLATIHALSYIVPPPGPPKYWAFDNSEENLHLVRRDTHNHTHRTHFNDFAQEDTWLFRLVRQTVNNQYQAGISINGSLPCNVLQLAGLYAEDLGSQTIRVGVQVQRPVIALQGLETMSVQAGSVWSEPGVSATDPENGNPMQVTIGGDVVNTAVLGVYTITYTAVTAAGDIAETKTRYVTVIDTTSPVLTIGSNISLVLGDTWAGETAGVHYSALDNLDGDLTSAIVVTGWNGDTSTVGTFTRTYTVQDLSLIHI